jgi:hypothetical protein
MGDKEIATLKTVIESNGVNPNMRKHLVKIYETIGGNLNELQTSTGKDTNITSKGDKGDTYRYRTKR